MTQENKKYVKQETMLLVGLGALAVGFLMGVIFSAYQKPTIATVPSQQAQQGGQQFSSEQADKLLRLEKEVAANPNNVDAWIALGNIWFDSNNPQKAVESYNKALALRPDDANVLTDLGVMYRRQGMPGQAIAAFDRAAAADSRHEIARFNKGIVQIFDLKDINAGLETWQELVKVNPAATAPDGKPISQMIVDFKAKMAAQEGSK